MWEVCGCLRLNMGREDLVTEIRICFPERIYAFIEEHEYDLAKDRKKAVYACRLEDWQMTQDSEEMRIRWIQYAISWADYVMDFGDYDTREEFHHGTIDEWKYEVKKAKEWINLLLSWEVNE